VNPRHAAWAVGLAALIALPFVHREPYHLHILVLILIWSFAYTSWSIMGRFGLVSLGHGGFMGVGAYVTALLWNHLGVSPWIGIPVSMLAAGILAVVVAYPCFRFRITGHYFVLVTLALSVSPSRRGVTGWLRIGPTDPEVDVDVPARLQHPPAFIAGPLAISPSEAAAEPGPPLPQLAAPALGPPALLEGPAGLSTTAPAKSQGANGGCPGAAL